MFRSARVTEISSSFQTFRPCDGMASSGLAANIDHKTCISRNVNIGKSNTSKVCATKIDLTANDDDDVAEDDDEHIFHKGNNNLLSGTYHYFPVLTAFSFILSRDRHIGWPFQRVVLFCHRSRDTIYMYISCIPLFLKIILPFTQF